MREARGHCTVIFSALFGRGDHATTTTTPACHKGLRKHYVDKDTTTLQAASGVFQVKICRRSGDTEL